MPMSTRLSTILPLFVGKKSLGLFLGIGVALAMAFLFPSSANAQLAFTENWEDQPLGAINVVNTPSWATTTSNQTWTVQNTGYLSSRAGHSGTGGNGSTIQHPITGISFANSWSVLFWMKADTLSGGSGASDASGFEFRIGQTGGSPNSSVGFNAFRSTGTGCGTNSIAFVSSVTNFASSTGLSNLSGYCDIDMEGLVIYHRISYNATTNVICFKSWRALDEFEPVTCNNERYIGSPTGTGTSYYLQFSKTSFNRVTDVSVDQIYVSGTSDVIPVPTPCELGGTCIYSMTPEAGSVNATSSVFTLGVTGFISDEDYEDGMFVELSYYRRANLQSGILIYSQIGSAPDSGVYEFPITSAGEFEFTTTADIQSIGDYYLRARVGYEEGWWHNVTNFFGFQTEGEIATEKQLIFTVVEQTGVDLLYTDIEGVLTGGTEVPILDCSISWDGFDLWKCLYSLVVPNQSAVASQWQSLMSNSLSVVPLGYITRFMNIMMSGTAVQPPPLEYTFGSSSPAVLQGKGVSFQIFDNFDFLNSIEADDGSGKNIWGVVMPYFQTIIALGVLGVILFDILAIGVPNFSGGGRSSSRSARSSDDSDIENMKINDYSDISEENWQNMKKNRLL